MTEEAQPRLGRWLLGGAVVLVAGMVGWVLYEGHATEARSRIYTRQNTLLNRARPRITALLSAGDSSTFLESQQAVRDAVFAEAREEATHKAAESLRVLPRSEAALPADSNAEMLVYFSSPRDRTHGFMCLLEKNKWLENSLVMPSKNSSSRSAEEFVAIADAMWDAAAVGDAGALDSLAHQVSDNNVFVGYDGTDDQELRFSGMQLRMLAAALSSAKLIGGIVTW